MQSTNCDEMIHHAPCTMPSSCRSSFLFWLYQLIQYTHDMSRPAEVVVMAMAAFALQVHPALLVIEVGV